jgi:hypothetical protein
LQVNNSNHNKSSSQQICDLRFHLASLPGSVSRVLSERRTSCATVYVFSSFSSSPPSPASLDGGALSLLPSHEDTLFALLPLSLSSSPPNLILTVLLYHVNQPVSYVGFPLILDVCSATVALSPQLTSGPCQSPGTSSNLDPFTSSFFFSLYFY